MGKLRLGRGHLASERTCQECTFQPQLDPCRGMDSIVHTVMTGCEASQKFLVGGIHDGIHSQLHNISPPEIQSRSHRCQFLKRHDAPFCHVFLQVCVLYFQKFFAYRCRGTDIHQTAEKLFFPLCRLRHTECIIFRVFLQQPGNQKLEALVLRHIILLSGTSENAGKGNISAPYRQAVPPSPVPRLRKCSELYSYVVIIYHGPDSDNGEIAAVQKDLPFFLQRKGIPDCSCGRQCQYCRKSGRSGCAAPAMTDCPPDFHPAAALLPQNTKAAAA